MADGLQAFTPVFDAQRRASPSGSEYWMARDLQPILEYAEWRNFLEVIEKAKMACLGAGVPVDNHFVNTNKMVTVGGGVKRVIPDYFLSRYACYLVAMNGDPAKHAISAAQTYFAVQTRKQELQQDQLAVEKRVELRARVTNANKGLNDAAKIAGVQNYGLFHDAGYRGLYGMGLGEIKRRKNIEGDLLDHAGRAELAANEFRITQTEQKITRDRIKGEQPAIHTHKTVGAEVRATIEKLGGTMPEDLPAEQSLKKLTSRSRAAKLPKPRD